MPQITMARFAPSLLACQRLFCVCIWLHGAVAVAAGTDVVRLTNGEVLRGQVVRREADGTLLLAVRRAWLSKAIPKRAATTAVDQAQQSHLALKQLADRIDTLLNEPAGQYADGLVAFLRRERARVADILKAVDPTDFQFIWVVVPEGDVRSITLADPDWRQLVQWGWHEELADVETMPRPKLARLLKARDIVATDHPPSLSDRLPPLPQKATEWQARIALLEDAYGPPVRFQGTGDIVVPTDGALRIESILPIITQMIGGDVGGLFGVPDDPLRQSAPPEQWLLSARHQAADAGRFRATRVQPSPKQSTVEVESVFEVRLPEDGWTTLWREHVKLDASIQRGGFEEQIAADPRIGQALEGIKGLGVFSETDLTQALRFGAATMAAKQTLDQRFDAFNSTFTTRLDGPPLIW